MSRLEGCPAMLALLLCLVAMTGHGGAQESSAAAREQDAEGASAHATWRMEATAHVASLAIRNMYCKLDPERRCESLPPSKLRPLQRWAMADAAWTRLLASLSNYELGRRFWQQQDYQKSLEVVEWSIAYKLFPYEDPELQSAWQHNLMGTSQAFKRPKLELADGLILMANCMYEIGRRQSSVEHLYLSLEAVHLSATLMHNSMDLVQEVLGHLELLSQHVALALTQALTRIKSSKLMELMVVYGAQCSSCVERRDFVEALLVRLSLPVRYDAGGSAAQLEVTHPTFVHDAYVRQSGEAQEQFSRRLMQQLVGMVRLGLLSDLNVPCSKWSDEQDCEAHMPGWLHSANKTATGVAPGSGLANAVGSGSDATPVATASSAGDRGGAVMQPLEPMLPPEPSAIVDILFSGDMQQDLRRLHWTLDLLAGQHAAAAAAYAAANAPNPEAASAWAALATSWEAEQEAQDPADIGHLDWQSVPPFPPPPVLMPGAGAGRLGLMPPLPFKPPRPTVNRPPSFRKLYDASGGRQAVEPEPLQPSSQRQPPSAVDSVSSATHSAPSQPHTTREAPPPPGTSPADTPGSSLHQQHQHQQRGSACCNPQHGVLTCCNVGDGSALGGGPGSSSGTVGSSFTFTPWIHTRAVWASFQDTPLRPAAEQLLPERLVRKAAEAVRSSRNDPLVMLMLSGLSATAMLSYTVIKHRRRMGRLLSCTSSLLGRLSASAPTPATSEGAKGALSTSRAGQARVHAQAAGGCAVGPGPLLQSANEPPGLASQRRKAAAAALRDALAAFNPVAPSASSRSAAGSNSGGSAGGAAAAGMWLPRLEAAIMAAEAAGVQDIALLQRAEAMLTAEQRRRGPGTVSGGTGGSSTAGNSIGTSLPATATTTSAAAATSTAERGVARQRSRGRTGTSGSGSGGGSAPICAPPASGAPAPSAALSSSSRQPGTSQDAGHLTSTPLSSLCTANKARQQQRQPSATAPVADCGEPKPSLALGSITKLLVSGLSRMLLPHTGSSTNSGNNGGAGNSRAGAAVPTPLDPNTTTNTANSRPRHPHTRGGGKAGAGHPTAPDPTNPTASLPSATTTNAATAAGCLSLSPGVAPTEPGAKLIPAKLSAARRSAGSHIDNLEHSGGPSSPQSTSTGSSSFAERISRSSTGRELPAAASAAPSSSSAALAPSSCCGDSDTYVWETLPPELTDEGWQEGNRKKRGGGSAMAALAKYRQADAVPTTEPLYAKPPATAIAMTSSPAATSAAVRVQVPAVTASITAAPVVPAATAPASSAATSPLASAQAKPVVVASAATAAAAMSPVAAPGPKQGPSPTFTPIASPTMAALLSDAITLSAPGSTPVAAPGTAPASHAATVLNTPPVAPPAAAAITTAAAAAAAPAGVSTPKGQAGGTKAGKQQTLPLQQAPQQPGADVIILTRAKPVKTKLSTVNGKSSGGTAAASAAAAAAATATTASSAKSQQAVSPGPAAAVAGQQQGSRTAGASPAPSPSSTSSVRHQTSSRTQASHSTVSGVGVSGSSPGASKHRPGQEQASSMYRFTPPPPPPPPRTPPAHSSTPASATASSPAASPLAAGTPCAPPPTTASSPSTLVAGSAPGEPNPFAQPSAAMLAAAANTSTSLNADAPPYPYKRSSSGKGATLPGFGEPAAGQSLSAKAPGAGTPHNPFKPIGAEVLSGGSRPLGNGALGLQLLGGFRSAEYDSLSLLDGHHTLSHDHHDLLGVDPATRDTHAHAHAPNHLGSPSLQQPQFGSFQGLSGGGASLQAAPAGVFAPGLGMVDGGASSASAAAAPLSSLLFASSSVWSSSAVQATGGGSSWLTHSASVPLACGVVVEPRTSTGSSTGGCATAAAPAAGSGGAAAVAPGWLPLGSAGGAMSSASSLWSAAPATLFGGSSSNAWGNPLGGMSLNSPTGGAPSLSHGLPQIPSESDLVGLDLAFVAEPDGLLGTSPDLKGAEAPEWAHQIMSVVE